MKSVDVTPQLTALLADAHPVGDGETPCSVHLSRWTNGSPKRLRAQYPNGWVLTLNFRANGNLSSCCAKLDLKFSTKPKAAA